MKTPRRRREACDDRRLSVDLDFNLIGPPREVVQQGAPIRKAIEAVLRDQDPAYDFKFRYRADQTTLLARYAPQSGGARQPLKIELSMRESVPILGLIEKSIPSPDAGSPIKVKTYSIDEFLYINKYGFFSILHVY